jgi:Methylamine utilisation protein MauE
VTAHVLAPPTFLAAGLLAVAGAAKIARPHATEQLLSDLGIGGPWTARSVGAVEIAIAGWATVATAGAYALAFVYVAFAGFLGYVLVARPDAGSCGCAGAKTVPPSALHLSLDVLAGLAALGYAVVHGPSARTWVASLGPGAVPVLAGLLLAAWVLTVAVAEAPAAWRAWSPAAVADHEHEAHDHPRADDALALAGIGAGHPSLWPNTAAPAEDRTA